METSLQILAISLQSAFEALQRRLRLDGDSDEEDEGLRGEGECI